MQTAGNIIIKGEEVLVLIRQGKYSRSFKLRKSGRKGKTFYDESIFISEHPDLVDKLLKGEIVTV